MDEQQAAIERIAHHIGERFPMYRTDLAFEQWLYRKAGSDRKKIDAYLDLLHEYGFIGDDGMLSDSYAGIPDPDQVEADIERRLATLDAPARRLLSEASVEGARFNVDVATFLHGSRDGVEALLRSAEAAGLIARDENQADNPILSHHYRFVPLRLRDILYEELPEEDRVRLHTSLVELLGEEVAREGELGAQDMLARMISEHNRQGARPDPPAEKG